MTSGRLAALSALVAVGGVAGYILLFQVAAVRNHPQIYVATAAVATVLAVLALVRARRWPAWLALGLSVVLLALGVWVNVAARIPGGPPLFRVGERPPDFTLPDATGRPVSLADYQGKKPVVLVFYRGEW
jgi:cytochrome oxidase Cu insertion factor (SCO1/SenC/PrrC family)